MGECLKRAWIGYKKYKMVVRIIAAFVGAIVGISGCVAFAKVYHNYSAAVWAAISALLAIVFLHLHFAVRRDHERLIPRLKFTVIMLIGASGLTAGVIGFITYIVLGIKHHESGKRFTGPWALGMESNCVCGGGQEESHFSVNANVVCFHFF